MVKPSDVLVGLPAYNEETVIAQVIKGLKAKGFSHIVVVDDCSKDNTFYRARAAGAIVLRHVINRGAGAATGTLIAYAKETGAKYLLLMDSDGQHSVEDALQLTKHASKYDVIIGSRLLKKTSEMPIHRKIANVTGSLVTFFFFGIFVRDSQTGFKLLNRKAIESIDLSFDRFEFASEMLSEMSRNKLTFKEIPIQVIYTDYSLSHGQSILNGFRMILRFIFRL